MSGFKNGAKVGQNSLLTILICLKKTSILSYMDFNVLEWVQI